MSAPDFAEGSYRILADATYDWESWIECGGPVRWVNPSVYRFTGWTVEECLQMSDYPLPLVHADDRHHFGALLSAGMSGAEANDVEFRICHRSGAVLSAAASWTRVSLPGMPAGLRLSIRDITARKQAETALRVSESLYRSVAESAWEGIWLLDGEGRTEFVNQRMAELLGETPESMQGREFAVYLPAGDCQRVLSSLSRLAPAARSEVVIQRVDGRQLPVLLSSAPRRTADGHFGGFLLMALEGTVVGLTAVRESGLRDQDSGGGFGVPGSGAIRRGRRLTAMSRLAAQVAHEINNPLASVRNALRVLRDHALDSDERDEFHRLIDLEIERIGRVVRRMLDLQGGSAGVHERVDLNELLHGLVRLLEPTAAVRAVQIHFAECQLRRVKIPPDDLRQILFNILTNAIEASPEGAVVRVTVVESEDRTEVRVRDGGPGIATEHQSQIFEPFFSTREKSSAGVRGMGLAVCRGLAERLGLLLKFCCEPGEGTEFCVTLPLRCLSE
ncbi:MAG: ATP-binding protein [Planctomyces sp.]